MSEDAEAGGGVGMWDGMGVGEGMGVRVGGGARVDAGIGEVVGEGFKGLKRLKRLEFRELGLRVRDKSFG